MTLLNDMQELAEVNDYTDANILSTLISEGQKLSRELSVVKTYVDKRLVEDYELRVARFRNTLKRADEMNRREMDRLKGQRKMIEMMDDVLSTDKSEARGVFWRLHEAEKTLREGGQVVEDSHPI